MHGLNIWGGTWLAEYSQFSDCPFLFLLKPEKFFKLFCCWHWFLRVAYLQRNTFLLSWGIVFMTKVYSTVVRFQCIIPTLAMFFSGWSLVDIKVDRLQDWSRNCIYLHLFSCNTMQNRVLVSHAAAAETSWVSGNDAETLKPGLW